MRKLINEIRNRIERNRIKRQSLNPVRIIITRQVQQIRLTSLSNVDRMDYPLFLRQALGRLPEGYFKARLEAPENYC